VTVPHFPARVASTDMAVDRGQRCGGGQAIGLKPRAQTIMEVLSVCVCVPRIEAMAYKYGYLYIV
jgi:hypothetical protein